MKQVPTVYRPIAYLYNALFIGFGVFVAYNLFNTLILRQQPSLLGASIVTSIVLIAGFIEMLRRYTAVSRYRERLLAYSTGAVLTLSNSGGDAITSSAIIKLAERPEYNFVEATVHGPDWLFMAAGRDIYQKTRFGNYKASVVRYAVMQFTLPRQLPNVFFDSLQAGGKQYAATFDPVQRHSLEGIFDNYFVSYFPPQYTIDSMSFIAPDTMLALQAAAAYDIEIVGNQLFLYADLQDPSQQIPDMASHGQAIRRQLLDTITTYRDERLPYELGRQQVTPVGAHLKPFKVKWYHLSIGVILYIVFEIVARLIHHI